MRLSLATSIALILACGGGRDSDQAAATRDVPREAPVRGDEGEPSPPSPSEGETAPVEAEARRVGDGFAIRHASGVFEPAVVEFSGPELTRRYELEYDPASILTVITAGMAVELGLEYADELGPLDLLLGGETRSVSVAVLDGAAFGDQALDGLAVAICDACVDMNYNGRLGANALRHFEVVNERPGQMTLWLDPKVRERARVLDLQPFVRMRWVRGEGAPAGAWIEFANLSTRAMEDVVVQVGAARSETLERVEPGARERVQLEGAVAGEGVPEFVSGRWGALKK